MDAAWILASAYAPAFVRDGDRRPKSPFLSEDWDGKPGSRRPQGSLHLQLYIRRIEDLLERAPPTTAYNKTALLAQYQEALTGSERPPNLYQPPVSAPEQAYLAELRGAPGGIAVAVAPTIDQGLKGGDTIVRAPASAEVKLARYTLHCHSRDETVCMIASCNHILECRGNGQSLRKDISLHLQHASS